MKTIRLKENGIGRYTDVSPFPLGDLEIELQGIPNYSGEFRFVGAINGAQCIVASVTTARNRVNVPIDKLTAGKFSCRVIQYIDGKEVRIFKTEDLLITDVNGDFSAVPEIVEMQGKIKALTAENIAVKERIDALETALKSANTQIKAFEKRISTLEENNDIFTA